MGSTKSTITTDLEITQAHTWTQLQNSLYITSGDVLTVYSQTFRDTRLVKNAVC